MSKGQIVMGVVIMLLMIGSFLVFVTLIEQEVEINRKVNLEQTEILSLENTARLVKNGMDISWEIIIAQSLFDTGETGIGEEYWYFNDVTEEREPERGKVNIPDEKAIEGEGYIKYEDEPDTQETDVDSAKVKEESEIGDISNFTGEGEPSIYNPTLNWTGNYVLKATEIYRPKNPRFFTNSLVVDILPIIFGPYRFIMDSSDDNKRSYLTTRQKSNISVSSERGKVTEIAGFRNFVPTNLSWMMIAGNKAVNISTQLLKRVENGDKDYKDTEENNESFFKEKIYPFINEEIGIVKDFIDDVAETNITNRTWLEVPISDDDKQLGHQGGLYLKTKFNVTFTEKGTKFRRFKIKDEDSDDFLSVLGFLDEEEGESDDTENNNGDEEDEDGIIAENTLDKNFMEENLTLQFKMRGSPRVIDCDSELGKNDTLFNYRNDSFDSDSYQKRDLLCLKDKIWSCKTEVKGILDDGEYVGTDEDSFTTCDEMGGECSVDCGSEARDMDEDKQKGLCGNEEDEHGNTLLCCVDEDTNQGDHLKDDKEDVKLDNEPASGMGAETWYRCLDYDNTWEFCKKYRDTRDEARCCENWDDSFQFIDPDNSDEYGLDIKEGYYNRDEDKFVTNLPGTFCINDETCDNGGSLDDGYRMDENRDGWDREDGKDNIENKDGIPDDEKDRGERCGYGYLTDTMNSDCACYKPELDLEGSCDPMNDGDPSFEKGAFQQADKRGCIYNNIDWLTDENTDSNQWSDTGENENKPAVREKTECLVPDDQGDWEDEEGVCDSKSLNDGDMDDEWSQQGRMCASQEKEADDYNGYRIHRTKNVYKRVVDWSCDSGSCEKGHSSFEEITTCEDDAPFCADKSDGQDDANGKAKCVECKYDSDCGNGDTYFCENGEIKTWSCRNDASDGWDEFGSCYKETVCSTSGSTSCCVVDDIECPPGCDTQQTQ